MGKHLEDHGEGAQAAAKNEKDEGPFYFEYLPGCELAGVHICLPAVMSADDPCWKEVYGRVGIL
jgi:hypothetical protein